MIIDEDFWKEKASSVINVSHALSWSKVGPRLADCYHQFFYPIVGTDLMAYLTSLVKKENLSADETYLLFFARKALANLTFYACFDEWSVRVTDQGFQRQESDTYKSLYKYQSDQLKQNYKNIGFNALEIVVTRISAMEEVKEMWQKCPAYVERKNHIVQTMEEVNRVYDIHSSVIIFLALLKDISMVEKIEVPALLGHKLSDTLFENIKKDEQKIGSTTTEELRLRIGEIVSLMAVKRFVQRTGTITDRGVYYGTYRSEGGNPAQMEPATAEMLKITVAQIDCDVRQLTAALDGFVDANLSEFREGRQSNVLHRDNKGKKTFWA